MGQKPESTSHAKRSQDRDVRHQNGQRKQGVLMTSHKSTSTNADVARNERPRREPASSATTGAVPSVTGDASAAGGDFEALYHLYRLAWSREIDEPDQLPFWRADSR